MSPPAVTQGHILGELLEVYMSQGSRTLYWSVPAWDYEVIREKATGRGSNRRVKREIIKRTAPPFSSTIRQLAVDHCRNYGIPFNKIKMRVG